MTDFRIPTKREQTTGDMFWRLVELLKAHQEPPVSDEVLEEGFELEYDLAKYMIAHGGYKRLALSLNYLAMSVVTKLDEAGDVLLNYGIDLDDYEDDYDYEPSEDADSELTGNPDEEV